MLTLPARDCRRGDERELSCVIGLADLSQIRTMTGLGALDAAAALSHFAKYADSGRNLSKPSFFRAFEDLWAAAGDVPSVAVRVSRRQVIDRLFRLFDRDGSGFVDYTELSSGLSVLCGGSSDSKAESAFLLFGTCRPTL
jgi:hypothetical protein